MAAKPPPTATKILATPICNVEESRAQRLQRQQSRFRDRGGIFVPSSRNTLVDILLGKASPIKRPRRSASLSPSKGRRKSNTEKPKSLVRETSVHEQNLIRSPRKQRRSSSVASGTGGHSPKASSITPETPTNASKEVDDNPASIKGPSRKKTPASRRTKKPSSSKVNVLNSTKKVIKTANSHEEIEPRPKRTRSNVTISSADLMNLHANELQLSETVSSVASSSKASSTTRSRNSKRISRNIPSDDEEYEEGASKSRRKKPATTKSHSSSSNRKSSSRPSASKPSKSRPGAPQLPDIMEEDEDEALPPSRHSSPNEDSPTPTTTKKRLVIDEDHLTDGPRKRAKPARKDATVKQSKTKDTSKPRIPPGEEPSPVQKKRRHLVEQDEDADADADGTAGKPAKRKKVVFENEKVEMSPLKLKKNVAKPKSKSAPKVRKPTTKKAPTKTAKRKENSIVPQPTQLETPQVSVPPRRGPPKSILLRLQNSSAPHVVDDEPDPIDFLS